MRAAGATVKHAGELVPRGAPDQDYLEACGAHGWIFLTRDQQIRRRPLEREALQRAGVAAFACTAGQATAAETAATIVPMLQKMANMSISEPKPFLYTFGLAGKLSRVPPRELRN